MVIALDIITFALRTIQRLLEGELTHVGDFMVISESIYRFVFRLYVGAFVTLSIPFSASMYMYLKNLLRKYKNFEETNHVTDFTNNSAQCICPKLSSL